MNDPLNLIDVVIATNLVRIVVVQTGFRVKFALPSDASARVG